ncbi:gamma-glutamyltransferase family protein [Pseudochelatococcus sp. B33]
MTFTSRPIVMADRGLVVSGHHRASEAGAAVLRAGGNAFDAAITAATTLAVAVPHMNGIGGDAIALCYSREDDRVFAINGSGRSPAAATVEAFRRLGHDRIPSRGPLSMSVCGVVHAWEAVLKRLGTISFSAALQPAIALAETGVPVDGVLQTFLEGDSYKNLSEDFPDLASVYGPVSRRTLGSRLKQTRLAQTLRELAEEGAGALYGGEVGRRLVEDLNRVESLLTLEDLAGHDTLIGESLSVKVGDHRLHVAPPNSQGIALAYMAGLRDAQKRAGHAAGALTVTDFLRLKRIAFEKRDDVATDPGRSPLRTSGLDDEPFGELLAGEGSTDTQARAGGGDTSTLVVVDRWGNAVSWVQSLFDEFGSGVLSPSTGIVMHNRLYLEEISDDPVHGLLPSTRPFHTLCPALLVGDGCEVAIATPGDHGQPQAIFQVLANVFEHGLDLQMAIDAPRVRHDRGEEVLIENRAPASWRDEIRAAGLTPREVGDWSRLMGGVNAIQKGPEGVLFGAADPRRASYAVAE